MGGDPHDPNAAAACLGNDVIDQLNDVFSDPHSGKYQTAWNNREQFNGVTDVAGLKNAYGRAGLNLSGQWEAYLRRLQRAHPENISAIATFRYNNLNSRLGMSTITHLPEHGGRVRTEPGAGMDPAVIDSPYPLPD